MQLMDPDYVRQITNAMGNVPAYDDDMHWDGAFDEDSRAGDFEDTMSEQPQSETNEIEMLQSMVHSKAQVKFDRMCHRLKLPVWPVPHNGPPVYVLPRKEPIKSNLSLIHI